MSHPNFILLYVSHPAESAAFWSRLLDTQPIESSPTFVMFALSSGVMLGLWQRAGVSPTPGAAGDAGELAIAVGPTEVDAIHGRWQAAGVRIVQPPTELDFGRAFLATDPDGHRIRVFAPRPE